MTDTLRVGYDAGPLFDPPTGVGRYVAELGEALEALGMDLSRYAVAFGGTNPGDVARWKIPARAMQALWRTTGAPVIEHLTGPVDVVHATNFVLPAVKRTPGIVTVHDLSFYRDDVFPGGERLRELVPWSIERAAGVITPTRAIADEVQERFGIADDHLHVTLEGVAPAFFAATPLSDTALGKMGIPGPFAVAVGTIEPRKNLPRLLRAWEVARKDLPGWKLVLAGPKGWGPELPEVEDVILTGWIGDGTLPGLMAAASFFCYPSLYEGFGLPPLEAMAAGTPALVGRYSAAPEVLGDGALLVDPTDIEALADGMVRLATDDALRASLQVAGRARATAYTWLTTGKATIRAYRHVVGR